MRRPVLKLINGFQQPKEVQLLRMEQVSEKHKRSLDLPKHLWDFLEEDAKRTRRSITGMLDAILSVMYMDADIEVHGADRARSASPVALEMERQRQSQRRVG